MNSDNSRMDFFYPFGIKIMIGEKSPEEDKARGLLDRSFKIKSYKGYPAYDIKEIMNPQGNVERQQIFEELMDLRKLFLMFRLVHFKDPYIEIDIGLDGRDRELCKPMLQLFYTLGASEETQRELEATLQHFLDIKNRRKGQTLEAVIYPIIVSIVSEIGERISTSGIWELITKSLEGDLDEKNTNVFYSSDYGKIYRNRITRMICDKFGAEIDHKEGGNEITFNLEYLTKIGKIYENNEKMRIRPIDNMVETDPLTHKTHPEGKALVSDNLKLKNDYSVENKHKIESSTGGESGESVNQPYNRETQTKKKCPHCDYEEDPFYLKIHLKNAHLEK
jgi:hypothetical protein